MRYLEDINGKTICVQKCSNTKYSEGEIKFSRKCTRCDYIETVKAHTIFQGIKFPLQNVSIFFTSLPIAKKSNPDGIIRHLGFASEYLFRFSQKVDKKNRKNKNRALGRISA